MTIACAIHAMSHEPNLRVGKYFRLDMNLVGTDHLFDRIIDLARLCIYRNNFRSVQLISLTQFLGLVQLSLLFYSCHNCI